jgi:transcriptional regulator with XRE-family HTH domain
MNNLETGFRLLQVRQENRLSQQEFSRRLGIPSSSYQTYERGDRELPASVIEKLHDEFQVNPLWLIKSEESEKDFPKKNLTHDLQLLKAIFLGIDDAEKRFGSHVSLEGKLDFALLIYRRFLADGAFDAELISTWISSGAKENV